MKSIEQSQATKKPKINPHLLQFIRLIIITLISVLNPEAILVTFLIKLLFIILGWLNQK